MTGVLVEIRRNKLPLQRNLGLDKSFRDALADYCRRRWPSNTAKNAARAFGWSVEQGRGAVAGRASLTALEQAIKNGGWSVVFPLVAEVIGQSAEQYIIEARKANEERGERFASLASNLWPVASVASPAASNLDNGQDERPRARPGRVG